LGKLFLSAVPAALAGLAVVALLPPILVAVALPAVVAVVYGGSVVASGALTDADVAFAAQFGPTAEELVATAAAVGRKD